MHTIQKICHIGIYGCIEYENSLLVIHKARGPYKGLFDLPGGRPLHGEPLLDGLSREIEEETGMKTQSYSFFGNFSYLVPYRDEEGIQKELYHIALIYRVHDVHLSSINHAIIAEDVNGSLWVNRNSLRKEDCSPLLWSVLEGL